MTANQKAYILSIFHQNEDNINRVAGYIADAAADCTRVHSDNGHNIAGYASNLAEYKGFRDGMFRVLNGLGYVMTFDGEHVTDIERR